MITKPFKTLKTSKSLESINDYFWNNQKKTSVGRPRYIDNLRRETSIGFGNFHGISHGHFWLLEGQDVQMGPIGHTSHFASCQEQLRWVAKDFFRESSLLHIFWTLKPHQPITSYTSKCPTKPVCIFACWGFPFQSHVKTTVYVPRFSRDSPCFPRPSIPGTLPISSVQSMPGSVKVPLHRTVIATGFCVWKWAITLW